MTRLQRQLVEEGCLLCGFLGGCRLVGLWRMKGREIDAVCWRGSLSAPVPSGLRRFLVFTLAVGLCFIFL